MRISMDNLRGIMAATGLGTMLVDTISPVSPVLRLASLVLIGGALTGYALTVRGLRQKAFSAAVSAFADRELARQATPAHPRRTQRDRIKVAPPDGRLQTVVTLR